MKKIMFLILSFLLGTVGYAQSTCETRVDAHQNATTPQRVSYCLTPDTVVYEDAYAGLVFSGVTDKQPKDAQTKPERVTTQEGNFAPERVSVDRSFVPTAHFPQALQNETQAETTVAIVSSNTPETTQEVVTAEYVPQPVERFMADEVGTQGNLLQETIVQETPAGVKARQNKPRRSFYKATEPVAQEQPAEVIQTVETAETVVEQPVLSEDPLDTISDPYGPLDNNMYMEVPADATSTPAAGK